MGVAIVAVNFAMADITIKNSNDFDGTQNVTANPTATATVSNVSATATGGSVTNSGNSVVLAGSCSDCNECSSCSGTTTGGTTTGGTTTATGGTATANSGTTTASAQSNTSVSQSGSSDSTTKVTFDTDKNGHRHYYKRDKDGHKHYYIYKALPATGSNMIVLAGIAILSLLIAAVTVKKYSTK